MPNTIKFKRGLEANLPTLEQGEPAITTDSNKFFIGDKEFAGLNNGKLEDTVLPDTAISDYYEVATYLDLSTLMVAEGDQAKVLDEDNIYLYDGTRWLNITVNDGGTF